MGLQKGLTASLMRFFTIRFKKPLALLSRFFGLHFKLVTDREEQEIIQSFTKTLKTMDDSLKRLQTTDDCHKFSRYIGQLESKTIDLILSRGFKSESKAIELIYNRLWSLKHCFFLQMRSIIETAENHRTIRQSQLQTEPLPNSIKRSILIYILSYGGDKKFFPLVKTFTTALTRDSGFLSDMDLKNLSARFALFEGWKKSLLLKTFLRHNYLPEFDFEETLFSQNCPEYLKSLFGVFYLLSEKLENLEMRPDLGDFLNIPGFIEAVGFARADKVASLIKKLAVSELTALRVFAVNIATVFPDHREIFHTLLNLTKDPSQRVKSAAIQTLKSSYKTLFEMHLLNIEVQKQQFTALSDISEKISHREPQKAASIAAKALLRDVGINEITARKLRTIHNALKKDKTKLKKAS